VLEKETAEDVIQPTRDEMIGVYKDLSQPYQSPEQQERSVEMILNLDTVVNVAGLMDMARG